MSIQSLIARVTGDTFLSGGATISLAGDVPTVGYAVGGYSESKVLNRPTMIEFGPELADYIERSPLLTLHGHYLGTWLDGATGNVWLDVIKVHSTLAVAMQEAEQRGELAIYDLAAQQEIRLDVPAAA